jgi:hypothetical protein
MTLELLKNKIIELVLKSPDKAAIILSDWINVQPDPKKNHASKDSVNPPRNLKKMMK